MTTSAGNPAEAVISTVPALAAFLSTITPYSELYIDLEGENLCRYGTISIVTVLVHYVNYPSQPQDTTRLIDVATLGELAFTTPSSTDPDTTLKYILESTSIPKYLWDARNDADALWAHYHVALGGVTDVQLMENASRVGNREFLCGLDKAIQQDLGMDNLEFDEWSRTKTSVAWKISCRIAGIFTDRPMAEDVVRYCLGDVQYLPRLYAVYERRLSADEMESVRVESKYRLEDARASDYEPSGWSNRYGPWGAGPDSESEDDW
ncbi:ribonuclease H-like domain-containing protein [Podospora aff. communis PSN243]|uniref:Ribonuclease H-like domain-containing protein n=1 Tax=Podospora aff. communis PSN243 TaxID=3040156 RepID=A0AAV9G739_9PEZI|nr:ribonuclease H-like domain-containing protein [Podospora aff. communis PSN243]